MVLLRPLFRETSAMSHSNFSFRGRPRVSRSRRLFMEHLEDRRLLTTRIWTGNGANDLWSNAANWDTAVPVNGDDVVIAATANSAEVLFDSTAVAVTVNSLTSAEPFHITGSTLNLTGTGPFTMTTGLTLDGGTLDGTGTLDVSGTLTWTGGTMAGTGTTNANGGMTISSNTHIIGQRTLGIGAGTTATWTGGDIGGGNRGPNKGHGTVGISTHADVTQH